MRTTWLQPLPSARPVVSRSRSGRRPQPRRPLHGRRRPGDRPLAHAGRPCRTREAVATCQGGATWLDFDAATQAKGLVTPGGVVGSTGVTGLTLGGGIGHLTAPYGLTCDNLLAAELISPAGEIVRAR